LLFNIVGVVDFLVDARLGGLGGAYKSPQFTKAQGMLRVLERDL
jgi:hypothetical protein